ncbi:unnamed protein product [Eruca vesicaria subsp. sativa]|uniref:EID1-like F-box protein 2 n=1 Tax=Eruca vesicaria subsp. sativa TaxID=29727 RepID=A0ABC8KGE9_ERUVS|nr:unnamed protein product [Eruca vesicaria subsp. sativa]
MGCFPVCFGRRKNRQRQKRRESDQVRANVCGSVHEVSTCSALGKLLIYCSGSSKGGLFNDVQVSGHFVHRTRFSRTSGRSFLPLQCRNDDILYVSDPCEHLDKGGGEDGDLGFFRGIFKSFSMSKVRKLLIRKGTSFHPTEVCPYCKAKLWSMLQARMIPQSASCRLGAYEDSIEYYVCLNGHMLGVCTLLPLDYLYRYAHFGLCLKQQSSGFFLKRQASSQVRASKGFHVLIGRK